MKALRTAILSLLLAGAVLVQGGTAFADPLWQPGQAFADLPGVKSQEEIDRADDVRCKQVLVRRDPSINSGYRSANFCRRGDGPVFQSGRLPPSIIRQLRGFDY